MDGDHLLDRIVAIYPFSAPLLQLIVGELQEDPNNLMFTNYSS